MARLHSCNVIQISGESRRVWQFDATKKFQLHREQTLAPGQHLPARLIRKTWRSLVQPKLNVACLPAGAVFLQVIQLPVTDPAETRAMVEFQLEKISPLPVTQIAWGFHVLPHSAPLLAEPAAAETSEQAAPLQTVVVVIAARNEIESFLGKLEKEGFLADRVEVSQLDQLTAISADGIWIYLDDTRPGSALVAWRQDGILHNLGLISLPADKSQVEVLQIQLAQMTWAGEVEGWLTKSLPCHLVGGNDASGWQEVFSRAVGKPVEVVAPLSATALAAATARRAVATAATASLIPADFTARYRQQFVDRLWIRGLMAVGILYALGVINYFAALGFLKFQMHNVEDQVAAISGNYTNVLQLKARYQIMKERQDLKYAALDCWKITAQLLPEGATLETLDFRDGKKLTLRGTASANLNIALSDFNTAMRKATVKGKLLFSDVGGMTYNSGPNNTLSWGFACTLNSREELK